MDNRYRIHQDTAVIEVPYKKKVIEVTIDKEDISIASSITGRWILVHKDNSKQYFYFVCNTDKRIALHKLLLDATEDIKVYFKDKDHTNLRKSNLLINTYEVTDELRAIKKESYKRMSIQGKINLLRGIRENRYSKDWSDKLAESKKGLKNPKKRLTPKKVTEIRQAYTLENITQKDLAEMYQIGRTTVADIVNYRTWNEIGENPHKEYRKYHEDTIIPFNIKSSPLQYIELTNQDIFLDDFVLELEGNRNERYMFCQKIGQIKLYVEIRDTKREFVHGFEVVFPEYLTPQHIHNYVITQRKPQRYMNRHGIHEYMKILSTFIYNEYTEENDESMSY